MSIPADHEILDLLSGDSQKLLESTIESNLQMSPEDRIDAHEHARQLASDLRIAGEMQRAKSQNFT